MLEKKKFATKNAAGVAPKFNMAALGAVSAARKLVARDEAMTVQSTDLRLVVKHRYLHTDPVEGIRVSTRHRLTAQAAAASEMVDAVPIPESREERYVTENPNLM